MAYTNVATGTTPTGQTVYSSGSGDAPAGSTPTTPTTPTTPSTPPPTGSYSNVPTGTTPTGQTVYSSGVGSSPTPIPSTVAPPSGAGTPTPPPATAPTIADQFHTSLASTIDTQTASLQASLQQQTQNYQTQIDALNQKTADYQALQETGLANEGSAVQQETQAKQDALDQEKAQFQQNYDARQKLTDQLQGLLTKGQSIIEGVKNAGGLASIMDARVSTTMADVQGQAGVISTALAAYDSQIGLAQSQLKSATDAITSIYSDQISYWQNVISFYNTQQKDVEGQVASLTKDQKTYIDAQIQLQQDKLNQTQKTADAIQQAMLDPKTALTYAKAGVSLTDTPAQINQKVATQAYAEEIAKISQDMAAKGYSSSPVAGGEPITVKDSQGVSHTYYATKAASSPANLGGGAPTGYTKADKTAIDQALRSGSVNGQKIGNAIGSDGYIDPQSYASMLDYWLQQGGTKQSFVSEFPPKSYINPANTTIWDQIGIKNPFVNSSTVSAADINAALGITQ